MRNDLIAFEFSDNDRRETLIRPELVPAIAVELEIVFNVLVDLASAGWESPTHNDIEIFLSAVKPGSIILGFLVKWRDSATRRFKDDSIGATADISQLVQTFGGIVVSSLVTLGLVAPVSPERAPVLTEWQLDISKSALENPHLTGSLERLIDHVSRTGASKVSITVPDAPTCIITPDMATNPALVGSASVGAAEPARPVRGELQLTSETAAGATEHGSAKLYLGTFIPDGAAEGIPVLVEWRSRRTVPVPGAGEPVGDLVKVGGKLGPLKPNAMNSSEWSPPRIVRSGPVSPALRRVQGLLIVTTQVVEE